MQIQNQMHATGVGIPAINAGNHFGIRVAVVGPSEGAYLLSSQPVIFWDENTNMMFLSDSLVGSFRLIQGLVLNKAPLAELVFPYLLGDLAARLESGNQLNKKVSRQVGHATAHVSFCSHYSWKYCLSGFPLSGLS